MSHWDNCSCSSCEDMDLLIQQTMFDAYGLTTPAQIKKSLKKRYRRLSDGKVFDSVAEISSETNQSKSYIYRCIRQGKYIKF